MSESEGSDDLQELSAQLQQLTQVESEIETQIQGTQTRLQEVNEAIDALNELETDSTVQVPVGGDTYVRATIDDIDGVIVSLGADFAAEQTREEAIEILNDRIDLIEDGLEELQETLEDVQSDIEQLQGRAEQLRQQRAQQQLQEAGGDLGLGGGGLGGQD